jgi:hypothetical protein
LRADIAFTTTPRARRIVVAVAARRNAVRTLPDVTPTRLCLADLAVTELDLFIVRSPVAVVVFGRPTVSLTWKNHVETLVVPIAPFAPFKGHALLPTGSTHTFL